MAMNTEKAEEVEKIKTNVLCDHCGLGSPKWQQF